MNKKIAMSGLSIFAALAVMGGATFAAFTDTATATNNTFASGNADLLIAVDGGLGEPNLEVFAPSIAGADFDNVFPGFNQNFMFWLKNTSDSNIELNITADLLNLVQTGTDLDDALLIKWVCDLNNDTVLDQNTEASSEFSVRQWVDGGFATLGSLAQNEAMKCGMYSRVPTTATNDIAGESISFDVTYDATQSVAP